MNAHKPAFAQPIATSSRGEMYCSIEKNPDFSGLSKRELIAAMALQGLCANAEDAKCTESDPESFAGYAVACADELLRVLEKKE